MLRLKRALISVYDKKGILDLAQYLIQNNVEIVSTGGTYHYLKQNQIPVTDVESITRFPEMLDGRVKTMHPNILGGILAIRNNHEHMETLNQHEISPIDLVIVNLYPFFDAVTREIPFEEKIEFIDIGGPTMLRSAAKSYQDVIVITDPLDYTRVSEAIESLAFRKELAAKVFNLTAAYDAAIANFMLDKTTMPNFLSVSYRKSFDLRYGENPHQKAAYYVNTTQEGAMKGFSQLHGKELSFNNIRDMDLAWKVVCEFDDIACCGVKHSTPCAVAVAATISAAYDKMYESDPVSIFGGIVAFNVPVDATTASKLSHIFLEIVIAPEFSTEALKILQSKKNLRIVKVNCKPQNHIEHITVDGGILIQDSNTNLTDNQKVVTKKIPSLQQELDMQIGLKIVKHVKSNGIVVVKDGVSIGISGGQTNRIWATDYAIQQAKSTNGSILASDAFFPFRDCVDSCAKAGISAIIQPGGSIRDQDSVDACNEHGIAMVFSGIRHFKH